MNLSDAAHSVIIVETCAQACHEAHRAFCMGLGDTSQVSWEAASGWQRASTVDGVKGALRGNTPEQQHEQWMQDKLRAGWTRGEKKNCRAKTHPALVPYDSLPLERQLKYHLFITVARTTAEVMVLSRKPTKPSFQAPSAEDIKAWREKRSV